jgi:hypothetical protein
MGTGQRLPPAPQVGAIHPLVDEEEERLEGYDPDIEYVDYYGNP